MWRFYDKLGTHFFNGYFVSIMTFLIMTWQYDKNCYTKTAIILCNTVCQILHPLGGFDFDFDFWQFNPHPLQSDFTFIKVDSWEVGSQAMMVVYLINFNFNFYSVVTWFCFSLSLCLIFKSSIIQFFNFVILFSLLVYFHFHF